MRCTKLYNRKKMKGNIDGCCTKQALAFSIKEPNKNTGVTVAIGEKYYCSHCEVVGHSVERCFKANSNKPVIAHCEMSGQNVEEC